MTKKEKELNNIKVEDADKPDSSLSQSDVTKLEKKFRKLEKALKEAEEAAEKFSAEKEEYIGHLQKERAEFDNYRKRSQAQVQASFGSGVEDTVLKILPILDSLDLAIAHAPEEQSDFVKGIINVQKLFCDTLASLGVSEIESLDMPFDHDLHHALMQIDKAEDEEAGIVKQVLKKGYIKGEKVLRYAEVIVTK